MLFWLFGFHKQIMGKKIKLLTSLEFIVSVVSVFVLINISRGARLPNNARVESVNSVPKIEESLVVPKISVRNLLEVILTTDNLKESYQVVLTETEGEEGEICDTKSVVFPTYKLNRNNLSNNSFSMFLLSDVTKDLKNTVWFCLSKDSMSVDKVNTSQKNSWVHMGKGFKVDVYKSEG